MRRLKLLTLDLLGLFVEFLKGWTLVREHNFAAKFAGLWGREPVQTRQQYSLHRKQGLDFEFAMGATTA